MKNKRLVTVFSVLMLNVSYLFAEGQASQQSPFGSMLPLIVIFGIFYFLIIRPQQKKSKEHQSMLNALKKDDKIITNGGMMGTVTLVKGEIIEVKIADSVKVQLVKSGVNKVVKQETAVTPEVVK